jgi:hypothetical protein
MTVNGLPLEDAVAKLKVDGASIVWKMTNDVWQHRPVNTRYEWYDYCRSATPANLHVTAHAVIRYRNAQTSDIRQ